MPRTIGLLDHMGYGNLGDAAIQDAVIAQIRKREPGVRLIAFSLIPDDTMKRHGIPCHPLRSSTPRARRASGQTTGRRAASGVRALIKRHPWLHAVARRMANVVREARFCARMYPAVRALDVLVISGGGQLGDLWHGPWSHPYTVFKFVVLAKLARRTVYFLDVGAGPLAHPLSRVFARWAVRLGDYRSVRDRDSRDVLRALGVAAPLHVYPDPAYSLDVPPYVVDRPEHHPRPVVGLNPIGYCDPRLWPRRDAAAYADYMHKIAAFSGWVLDHDYELRVFTTELSVDAHAIADLRTRLRARGASARQLEAIFAPPAQDVEDVLRQMADLDAVVTSKFHGIIFAHLLGKPIISLSYHRKMDWAMHATGHGLYTRSVEHFTVDWLVEALASLIEEADDIRARYRVAVQTRAAALSQQFDQLFPAPASR